VEIVQTYLHRRAGDEIRIRKRGIDGHYVYYKTIKRDITGLKRVEMEERLTYEEYLDLLMEADTDKEQIEKTRYCLTYNSQYFEIDVYPFWKDKAIVEIELSDEHAQVDFPPQLRVIREVTEEKEYKNAELAKHH